MNNRGHVNSDHSLQDDKCAILIPVDSQTTHRSNFEVKSEGRSMRRQRVFARSHLPPSTNQVHANKFSYQVQLLSVILLLN